MPSQKGWSQWLFWLSPSKWRATWGEARQAQTQEIVSLISSELETRLLPRLALDVNINLNAYLSAELLRFSAHLNENLSQRLAADIQQNLGHVDSHLSEHFSTELQRNLAHVAEHLSAHITSYLQKNLAHLDKHLSEQVAIESQRTSAHLDEHLSQRLAADIQQNLGHVDSHLSEHFSTELQRNLAHVAEQLNAHITSDLQQLSQSFGQQFGTELHRQLAHVETQLTDRITQAGQNARDVSLGLVASEVAQARILRLARLLRPNAVMHFPKIRVGTDKDGGYVLVDDFDKIDAAISLGVGEDVSWDLGIAEKGIEVYQFDHTVDRLLVEHPRFHFARTKIVSEKSSEGQTLASIVSQLTRTKRSLIIKMDIEHDEWAVLRQTPARYLNSFAQIVCEFHNFQDVSDSESFDQMLDVLEKLHSSFGVVHVHANNFGRLLIIGNVPFPEFLEVTFANRSRYKFVESEESFPTKLDRPNRGGVPDIFIGRFEF